MYPLDPLYNKHYGKEYIDSLYASLMSNPFKFNWKKQNYNKEEDNFLRQSIQSSSPGMTTDVGENEYGVPQGSYTKTDKRDKDNKPIYTDASGAKTSLTSDIGKGTSFGDNLKANAPFLAYSALGLVGTFAKNNRLQRENQYNQERYNRMMEDNYLPSSYNPYEYNPSLAQTGDVVDEDLWNYIPQSQPREQEQQPIENENEFQLAKILNERRMKRKERREDDDARIDYMSLQYSGNPNPTTSAEVLAKGKQARDYLMSKGLDKVSASAIVGNLIQESNLKTQVIGDAGASFGIAQWNGDRRKNLHSFAQEQGKDVHDMFTQLDFVLTEQRNRFNRDVFSKLPTLEDKTKYFSDTYESPSKPMMSQRISYAQKILNME